MCRTENADRRRRRRAVDDRQLDHQGGGQRLAPDGRHDEAGTHLQFDEDDTSPIGQGLPSIVRDSQLSICAATRMTLDNASVVCGPQFEINTALMRAGSGPHRDRGVQELVPRRRRPHRAVPGDPPHRDRRPPRRAAGLVKMFMEFAEIETFIGPQTGGDMTQMPSEPMRTAAGASMAAATRRCRSRTSCATTTASPSR
jgi:hypothetical protein